MNNNVITKHFHVYPDVYPQYFPHFLDRLKACPISIRVHNSAIHVPADT